MVNVEGDTRSVRSQPPGETNLRPTSRIGAANVPLLHSTALQPQVAPGAARQGVPGNIRRSLGETVGRVLQTPLNRLLRRAVRTGNAPDFLLDHYDPSAVSRHGRDALHHAVTAGNAELVTELLSRGADPNRRTSTGMTALHLAAQSLNLDVAQALTSNSRTVDLRAYGSAGSAYDMVLERTQGGDVPHATELVDCFRHVAFRTAVQTGYADDVEALLAQGADPNRAVSAGRTALHLAAEAESFDLAMVLARHPGIVDRPAFDGKRAYDVALQLARDAEAAGDEENWEPFVDCFRHVAFLTAVKDDDADAVAALLAEGADPNRADPRTGRTALHEAAEAGCFESARALSIDERTVDAPAADGNLAYDIALRTARRVDLHNKDVAFVNCFWHVVVAGPGRSERIRAKLIASNRVELRNPDRVRQGAGATTLVDSLQRVRREIHRLDSLPAETLDEAAETTRELTERWSLQPGVHLVARDYLLRLPRELHEVPASDLVAGCLTLAAAHCLEGERVMDDVAHALRKGSASDEGVQRRILESLGFDLSVGDFRLAGPGARESVAGSSANLNTSSVNARIVEYIKCVDGDASAGV